MASITRQQLIDLCSVHSKDGKHEHIVPEAQQVLSMLKNSLAFDPVELDWLSQQITKARMAHIQALKEKGREFI